jgi:hypothetical protein
MEIFGILFLKSIFVKAVDVAVDCHGCTGGKAADSDIKQLILHMSCTSTNTTSKAGMG